MAATVLFISTSGDTATVYSDSGDHDFVPSSIEEDLSAAILQRRAMEVAQWAAKLPSVRRRLPLFCLDVETTTCAWLRAPSQLPQVLSTAFRNLMQEWGDAAAGQSIRPLDSKLARATKRPAMTLLPERNRKKKTKAARAAESAVRAAVMCQPDAFPRLVLSALDRMGVRPTIVTTLWHAAAAWAEPGAPGEVGAVLIERTPGRYIWVWTEKGAVIAAGHLRVAVPHEDDHPEISTEQHVAQRIAMDFTAWATHLGKAPNDLTIVAPNPEPLAPRIAAAWPNDPTPTTIAQPDPVKATLQRAADAPAAFRRASSVEALTNRPTRAVRKRYQLAAATLLIAGVAIGGLGYRMSAAASDNRAQAQSLSTGAIEKIKALGDPEIVAPNYAGALESRIVALSNKEPVKPPPAPKPILEELALVTQLVNAFEGIELRTVTIDDLSASNLQVDVPDRTTGTDFMVALQTQSKNMNWERSGANTARDEQIFILQGTWKNQ